KTIARTTLKNGVHPQSPDGNFTPRLSFGEIKGYEENGKVIPPFTDFKGMFELVDRSKNHEPHCLNQVWMNARAKLTPSTPINFVTTADGYAGNSGSPVFNKQREIVGVLFDGNYPGQLGRFMYDEKTKRSVCVDSRAILEVLEKVYGATDLVKE